MANFNERSDLKTDQEKLIEELVDSRALTAGFLSTVPGAFIVLDRQWRLVFLNDEAKKLFEEDEASLIGHPLKEVYPKNLGRILSPEKIQELIEGKENTIKRYANYYHRWYQISAYSSDHSIFIRLEDITPEMLINRLLRLNEFSVNRAKDMVFWFKTGSHIIFANMASCTTLGYSNEELTAMKATDIDEHFATAMWAKFVKDLKNAGSITYESSFRARDGSLIPVEVTCNYLEYFGDEYMMAFARDITVRKKTETALKESKAEAELYVDLMAHDINNMNQVAMGYLELGLELMRTEGRIDNDQVDLISKPHEMLLNSSRLIENVRKVRREKAGRYNSSVIDMSEVLDEVKNSYAHVAGRDIKIQFTRNGECRVAANELLKDIFLNLVGNSIKHSSGPLTIGIEMKKVDENGRVYCCVAVEDNGPGISDVVKSQLLHRLSPENTHARGKGFGLYLIKQLVDDFNGRFWMEDRVQGDHTKGARFVVMLPVANS